ncbi:MAG TPA: alpha-L-fucosidase [Armatimonadota bacterium]|jgi:alpha-L-fucosidase
MQWFNDARFGLFIHWGLYAIPAQGEWHMHRKCIPKAEYNRLADQFIGERFDADAWADLACRAGAKYMVLTTRHHDGFCLYDSHVSNFTSVKTRAKRDFVREYVEACRRAGLGVGLYYSLMDWQFTSAFDGPFVDPNDFSAMVHQVHAQVRELLTEYGKIDLLWYDGGNIPASDEALSPMLWRSKSLNAMARELQPHIIINDRTGMPEDFSTPEQQVVPPRRGRNWESCMTIGELWGYVKDEPDLKDTQQLIRYLAHAAGGGGNFLLNVGPRPDGTIQPEFVERLEAIGAWLRVHGEAIYGSERLRCCEATHLLGPVSARGNRRYYHLFDWPGEAVRIAGLQGTVASARLLANGQPLVIESKTDGTALVSGLPATPPDPYVNVIAVELSQPTRGKHCPTVLAERPAGRYDMPEVPILSADDLANLLTQPATTHAVTSESWCPGWQHQQVITSEEGALALDIEVAVTGRYSLAVGVIAGNAGPLLATLDGTTLPGMIRIYVGHYPDTFITPRLLLSAGKHHLKLRTMRPVSLGIYALQLAPIWQPVASEHWCTIGPFPTTFGPQTPSTEVARVLNSVYPPEGAFDEQAQYEGSEGRLVRWRQRKSRVGSHAQHGVNFAFRCKNGASGVCYARTIITCPEARDVDIAIGCDWWAKAYLNGVPVHSMRDAAAVAEDGASFSAWRPIVARLSLRAGENILLVKSHRGSNANWFTCFVNNPGDLTIGPMSSIVGAGVSSAKERT